MIGRALFAYIICTVAIHIRPYVFRDEGMQNWKYIHNIVLQLCNTYLNKILANKLVEIDM